MRILAVADRLHKTLYEFFDPSRWKAVDLIISSGDLNADYLSFLVTSINKPLLYVPGNHDAAYREKPPEGCDSVDGKVISVRGVRVAGLGGSHWYNGCDLQYTDREMERKVKKLIRQAKRDAGIDIFVSHAPPKGIHDLQDMCHQGFEAFRELIRELHPKVFIHGHNHELYGAKDRELEVEGVRVINACGYYEFDIGLQGI